MYTKRNNRLTTSSILITSLNLQTYAEPEWLPPPLLTFCPPPDGPSLLGSRLAAFEVVPFLFFGFQSNFVFLLLGLEGNILL